MPYAKPDEIAIDRQRLQADYALLDEWTQGPMPRSSARRSRSAGTHSKGA